jgi:ligand-binding sensor domain-containing protein
MPKLVGTLLLFISLTAFAQESSLYFRKLQVADGLNNGNVLEIGQDKRGFIWISTINGLNRFDGRHIQSYSHIAGDSSSIPPYLIRSFCTDSSGRFFAGHEQGLLKYNEHSDRFEQIKSLENYWVNVMLPVEKDILCIGTFSGLAELNTSTNQVRFLSSDNSLSGRVNALELTKAGLLIGKNNGLYNYDRKTKKVSPVLPELFSNTRILGMAVDASSQIWVYGGKQPYQLYKLNSSFELVQVYTTFQSGQTTIFNFSDIQADCKGRVWISTNKDGLWVHDPAKDQFRQVLQNPQQQWGPSTNLHSSLFLDRDGMLWIGGNNGINYFHPDRQFFSILPAFEKDPDILNRRIARIVEEDQNGLLWLGTMDGLVRYNPVTRQYTEWNNRENKKQVLYYNSIRGLYCDPENNIWMATGGGINKLNQQTGSIEFFGWKDSIPPAFYFSADTDQDGTIWFGCRDYDGFYYYENKSGKFKSIKNHPQLKSFAGNGGRKLFQDSRNRYWLGFNGTGVGMFNPADSSYHHWKASSSGKSGIAGDVIVDIREDKKGVIWISTLNGLSSIHPQNFEIKNYHHSNGLRNSSTSALIVDQKNRIWVGTGAGLSMLDSSRNSFTHFGLEHGLPSIEFPEHPATQLRNGEVMMPTQNGYIRFNPNKDAFRTRTILPVFTQLTISGNKLDTIPVGQLALGTDQNFISFGFTSINFENPNDTWYAYRLEGIDEDWKYTQQNLAEYTNLPGGKYRFRLKSSMHRLHGYGEELALNLSIATIFYKTSWFRFLLLSILFASGYLLYRYRIAQREKFLALETKAQLLEKEKVLVMYDSLKQQLNPHFLFNSLTSLSGLIETNQQLASAFLERLSKIYRYILSNRDSELVTIKEELAFVRIYIDLQKTRFKEGLQVSIIIPDELYSFKIAPVALQNLVENAIKHNIIDVDSPLLISIEADKQHIVVKNNLQKKNKVETSNNQGLSNLRSLYAYYSKLPILIETTRTEFIVKIPLI